MGGRTSKKTGVMLLESDKMQNNNGIFFTIVLPTYNRAHIISASIQSVIDQCFNEWELLVVDDGSSDNTAEVVENFKDPRVKYIYQDNAERSAARNNGIHLAKGAYVCFLDSDDQFDTLHLKQVYESIVKNEFKEAVYVVKSRIIYTHNKKETRVHIKKGQSDLETVLLNSITPGQFIVPTHILNKCGFNEEIRISEDTEILVRLLNLLPLKLLDFYSLKYLQHDDNSVNTDKYNAFFDRKETLELIFTYPASSTIPRKLKRVLLSNCFFGIYRFHVARGSLLHARWTMFKALFWYPTIRTKEKIYNLLFAK